MDRRKVVIGAAVVLVAISAVANVVVAVVRGELQANELWSLSWVAQPLVFAAAGGGILWVRPRNAIGRLLMLPAFAWVLDPWVNLMIESVDPDRVRWSVPLFLALVVDNLSWLALVFPIFHLMLVYPTGRLLSRRWRPVVALEVAMIALLCGLVLFSSRIGPLADDGVSPSPWQVTNPWGFVGNDPFESGWLTVGWPAGLVALVVAGVTATVLRFRRSDVVERQQMKWLLASAVFFGFVYVGLAASPWDETGWGDFTLGLSLDLIPAAVLVAVLRYRLFEIDRLISRTVGYALVAALAAAIYTGSVLAVSALLPEGANDLAVAASTLAAFAAIRPLRRATAGWVDRRFDRPRYDAARTVDETASLLRHRLDLEAVLGTLVDVTQNSLQPASSTIWVRPTSVSIDAP